MNPEQLENWLHEGRVSMTTVVIDEVTDSRTTIDGLISLGYIKSIAPVPPVQGYPRNQAYQAPFQYSAQPPKSKAAAAILAFFLGGFGAHRFYLGHTNTAVVMLLGSTVGWILLFPPIVVGIWALVDFILILTGGLRDASGAPLA